MNLTIKQKLFGGFSILLALLIGMAVFMSRQYSASNDRLENLVNTSALKIERTGDLVQKVMEVTRLEKNLILENNPVKQQFIQSQLEAVLESVEPSVSEIEALVDSRGGTMLQAFNTRWAGYEAEVREIMELTEAGQDTQAVEVSLLAGSLRGSAINHLQGLIDKNKADIQKDRQANADAFNSTISLMGFLVLLSILVALLTSFWIVKSIGNRISELSEKARKIASRENTAEEVTETVNDELSPITESLRSVNRSFREVTLNADEVASGNYELDLRPGSDKDLLGHSLQKMMLSLKEKTRANELHNWLTSGLNGLNASLIGNQELEELANNLISFLAGYVNAGVGAIYLSDENQKYLHLSGLYATSMPEMMEKKISFQEGLVGQAAKEKKILLLENIKEEHLRIHSTLVEAIPKQVMLVPFLFEDKVLGVLELGKLEVFSEREQQFIDLAIETISLSIHSAIARKKVQELLHETQVQSEELQTQQEELKQMNEELEEQTQNLKQQQEELQMTNEELEEQTQSLETRNKEVEAAKYDVEQKTRQLEISSKYKSEFLANMSHELRTPLNSLLLLSKDLSENRLNNLDEEQVESAEIIHKSGQDLLLLINEVLDLSRVEAGKMDVHPENVPLRSFIENLLKGFRLQAREKGLQLQTELGRDLPEFFITDPQRLNQILKNILANALKFTEKGSVRLSVQKIGAERLEIAVTDTGIGILEEKQMAIFEAFQQADGGTARKYGGTGLGLSISRELARLLGAQISLKSKFGEGSTFSVLLPLELKSQIQFIPQSEPLPQDTAQVENRAQFLDYPSIEDDRNTIGQDDKIVLIIEDDLKFAAILRKQAHQKGFKALTAATGEDGLRLAEQFKPHAIILDIDLPGMNGHQVLSQVKANPQIRHIPVHIASVNERTLHPFREGAVEYLVKPVAKKDLDDAFLRIENFVNRKMKNLLIIEDDANSRKAVRKLIGNGDVQCLEAGSGAEALELYHKHPIDCIVLDLGLPDMSGFDLIYKFEELKGNIPPIIIYTGKELTRDENEELEKYADSIIIKGVKSEERLLDETALFLHRTIENLPPSKQRIITNLYDKEAIFKDKNILVVDDDMRNVFALSKILKERGMQVIKAEHGKAALEQLASKPDFDLVLMDIMMPEMDGYEAMTKIRKQPQHRNLPIIALTAKAMKDDKQRCIDAGANDYITKPVDVPRLLSLMQVWLSK